MTTVQLDSLIVDLTQPLKDRPNVIVISASDGRKTVLGDGHELFSDSELDELCKAHEAEK